MPLFLRIVRWDEYQHYKHRDPPWIKLHRRMLASETWVSADDASRVLAIACMMLASGCDNRIPFNSDYVKRAAYLNAAPDFSFLVRCGFIEIIDENGKVASNMLAQASTMLAQSREETESENIEQRQIVLAPLAASPTTNGSGKEVATEKARKGSRLTVETLPDDWRTECLADRPDLDPDWVWKIFLDYWLAQPGRRGVKLDWHRTWRNWYRAQRAPPNKDKTPTLEEISKWGR